MCFVLIAIHQQVRFPCIIAANRDEYFERPTLPLGAWAGFPTIRGGRDRVSGGSWMAVDEERLRLALVTNYRSGLGQTAARSRGRLVQDALTDSRPLPDYLQQVVAEGDQYAGFNLIAGQLPDNLYHVSNRGKPVIRHLNAGIHVLSNASLNTPWPKARRGRKRLVQLLQDRAASPVAELATALFELLQDTKPAPDAELPDTGIGLERERWLSPIFVRGTTYGTRSSTVLIMDKMGNLHYYERTYQPDQSFTELVTVLNLAKCADF